MSNQNCEEPSRTCGFRKVFGNGDSEKNATVFKYTMQQLPGKVESMQKRMTRIEIYFWVLLAVSAKETLLPLIKLIP